MRGSRLMTQASRAQTLKSARSSSELHVPPDRVNAEEVSVSSRVSGESPPARFRLVRLLLHLPLLFYNLLHV